MPKMSVCTLVERGWELEMGLEGHSGYGASSGAEQQVFTGGFPGDPWHPCGWGRRKQLA